MVVRLAESLDLPLRERNSLLHTAGYAPAYPQTALDDPALAPVHTAIKHVLAAHMPYPAVVVQRHGDVVAANDAFSILTEGVAPELLEAPVNAYRLALHPKGIAPRIVNFGEWARHVVEGVGAAASRDPDERLAELHAELATYAPAPTLTPDHLGFAVPLRLASPAGELNLMTTITTFAT